MNIEKNLILIKNEDKTEEIINCSSITNGKRNITFKNNKTYTYSSYNVQWSRNCIEIDPQTVIVYEKSIPISGITKIVKFQELGYTRLIFKTGYHKLYHKSDLDIQKNSLEDSICKDCFSYLRELASNIDFENDNDFISRQYQRMTAISPDSVLAKYLNHKTIKHYPLNMLIRDTSKLDEKELQYATNSLTHTDFLIFRKIDKTPVLVVEVDGYAFHANNPKQLERDRMKDGILEKYNIPILRLPTNGSGEEEKLKEKLAKIFDI